MQLFPLIMANKIWLGYCMGRAISGFIVPDDYELYGTEARIDDKGRLIVSTNQCLWLTNIDVDKRHEDIPLYVKYSPERNPHYDNYDAIEVGETAEIPVDYFGVMGVPITFLDKCNPAQFEIVGLDRYTVPKKFLVGGRVAINGKPCYARILIRRRQ